MINLLAPDRAVRMRSSIKSGRKRAGKWHFQNPRNMNRTMCGIVIAIGYGWKYRNPARDRRLARRERWESIEVGNIKSGRSLCPTCLGAMTVSETTQLPLDFPDVK